MNLRRITSALSLTAALSGALAPAAVAAPGISGIPDTPGAQVQAGLPIPDFQVPQLPSQVTDLLQSRFQPPAPVNQDREESYIGFGDSLAANPTALDLVISKVRKKNPGLTWPTIRDGFCAQGANNFSTQAALMTGLRLVDYSCGGATAYTEPSPDDLIPHDTVRQQVERAIAEGSLDSRTRLVTISAGVNDTYQAPNVPIIATQEQRMARYHEAMTGAINRIKEAAPNAKVIMLGLADQTDGFNHTCATNLLGTTSHWYFPIVPFYQDEVRNQQRLAAEATGSEFLDMVAEISAASGKNGCSNDPGRYSAAVWDDAPHSLTFHLTDAGHKYYADRITAIYFQ